MNDYNNNAYNYIIYNDKLHCNIDCINLKLYKYKENNIYNNINNIPYNITLNFCINLENYPITKDFTITKLFNYVKSKLEIDNNIIIIHSYNFFSPNVPNS